MFEISKVEDQFQQCFYDAYSFAKFDLFLSYYVCFYNSLSVLAVKSFLEDVDVINSRPIWVLINLLASLPRQFRRKKGS